jgi:hypothetical protein
MNAMANTRMRRLAWAVAVLGLSAGLMFVLATELPVVFQHPHRGIYIMRMLALPLLASLSTLSLLTACAAVPASTGSAPSPAAPLQAGPPSMVQVVGLQWLNPLQRRDYPTEWQLLWTLGLVQPNDGDDMVRTRPEKYSRLQLIHSIAAGNDGEETFKGYHHKYFNKITGLMHDIYFSSSYNFYNAHSLTDKSTWRELAGIHIEYALPAGRLDPVEATNYVRNRLIGNFAIGNKHFPTAWTRSTPPDVRLTMGGPNAGFTSLAAAINYLQTHPDETVWAMNWDAPNFPPDDEGLNENMVLLVLAGPGYRTGRAPLAWIGLPATTNVEQFTGQNGVSRIMQAWTATINAATDYAGKQTKDIAYVIHDVGNQREHSSARLGPFAQSLTSQLQQLDYLKDTFNTPALLGEMGAGSALTNVALGIAYANHMGKNVLVTGTTELAQPVAVVVTPPAVVRPLQAGQEWFRARGENHAFLMWWGKRDDAKEKVQGYSY